MTAFEIAAQLLRKEEGLRLSKYQDGAGNWTIGYGHRCGKSQADITEGEAAVMLGRDLGIAWSALTGLSLGRNQKAACASLVMNIGVSAFAGSTLRRRIVASDLVGAGAEFMRWIHIRKGAELVVCQGLVKRRERERFIFERGDEK